MPTGIGGEVLWLCPSIQNSAKDLSNNGFSATYNGEMSTTIDTSYGGKRAYLFSGTASSNPGNNIKISNYGEYTSYAKSTIASDVSFDGVENLSVCFWVNPDEWSGPVSQGHLVRSGAFTTNLNTSNGNLELYIKTVESGSWSAKMTGPSVSKDTWTHVCLTYDGNNIRIYLNGSLESVIQPSVSGILRSSSSLMIGGSEAGYQYDLNGKMDDIRIFNKVISGNEIRYLASARGIEGSPPVGLGTEDLWVSPTLTSNDVSDITGNGNNALYNGTVAVVEDTTGFESFQTSNTTAGTDYAYFSSPSSDVAKATLSFWASSNFTPSYAPIAGFSTSAFNDLRFFVSRKATTGTIRVNWKGTGGGIYNFDVAMPNGSADLTGGGFHHWALVTSGGYISVYFDGVLLGTSSASVSGDIQIGGTNLSLGSQDGRTTGATAAKYDDIRFFQTALTSVEIGHLASARGVQGLPPVGLGDERLWLCPSISDSANDISGNGNNGTLNGNCSVVAQSGMGGTNAFSSSSYTTDFVSVPNVLPANTVRSICCWVYGDTIGAFQAHKLFASSLLQMKMQGFGEVVAVQTLQASPWSQTYMINSNTSSVNGAWHHYCLVQDGTDAKAYLDGSLVGVTTLDPNVDVTGDSSTIELNKISGYGDDFRLYHRALTQAEITHLASSRGILGRPQEVLGLGDERLWLCPTITGDHSDLSGNGSQVEMVDASISNLGLRNGTGAGGKKAFNLSSGHLIVKREDIASWRDDGVFSISLWVSENNQWGENGRFFNDGGIDFRQVSNLSTFPPSPANTTGNTSNDTGASHYGFGSSSRYWRHHVFVCDGVTSRCYVDGRLTRTRTGTGSYALPTQDFYFGASNSTSYNNSCYLDDIRLYSRALTGEEISHLASSRGVEGPAPVGLGDEQLWLCPSLNDSADDISGNGNNGTYNGGMGTVADTEYGGSLAYEFDGTDDYIQLPSSACNFGSSDFSLSFWLSSTDTTGGPLFNNYSGTGPSGKYFLAHLNNDGTSSLTGDMHLTVDDGSQKSDSTTSSKTYNDGNWRHFTIVRDTASGYLSLYEGADPTPVISTYIAAIGELNGAAAMRIGSWTSLITRSTLDGKMDDIRHYSRVLTQAEITHLASKRGVQGRPKTKLENITSLIGDEILWLAPSATLNETLDLANNKTVTNDGADESRRMIRSTGGGVTNGYSFRGSTYSGNARQKVLTGSDPVPNFPLTISLWARGAVDGNIFTIVQSGGRDIMIYSSSGAVTFRRYNLNSPDSITDSSININDGKWYHLCATISATDDASFYVNGKLIARSRVAINELTSLGTIQTSNGKAYTDDIRLFNKVLTQQQIKTLASKRVPEIESINVSGLGGEKLWMCPSLGAGYGDISGENNDGIRQGGLGIVADSSAGGSYAYDFDGVDDYIQTTLSDTDWRSGNGDFTICGWYKTKNKYATGRVFNDGAVYMGQESNFNRAGANGLLPSNYSNFSNPLYPNSGFVWRHFAMTFTAGGIKVYQNGAFESEVTAGSGTTVDAQSYDARIGYVNGTYWTNGYVDDVRVFSRVLTQAEIVHLASSRGVEGPVPVGLGDEKLWLCPSLSDGAGDLSGSGNNGSYSGGMATVPDVSNGGTRAYENDSTNQFIEVTGTIGTTFTSVSMWIKRSAIENGTSWFCGNNAFSSSGWSDALYSENSNDYIKRQNFGQITPTLPSSGWFHFAKVSNGTTTDIYVDGVLHQSLTLNSPAATTSSFKIGSSSGSTVTSSKYYDDIRVYDRPLTQAEITHLASSRGVQGSVYNGLGDEKLWLCATLNRTSPVDLSGNGNNGTFNGMTINYDHFYQGLSDTDSMTGTFSSPFEVKSLSFWVSSSSIGSSSVHLKDSASGVTRFGDSRSNKRYRLTLDGVHGNYATTFINQNVWHNVVLTYDPNEQIASIYIDGVLDGQQTRSASTTISDSYEIGSVLRWSRYDDIRVYDRVLTQKEIIHLSSSRGIEGPPPVGLGDEIFWACPTLQPNHVDLSPSARTLTLNNGASLVEDSAYGGSRAYEFDGIDDTITTTKVYGGGLRTLSWSMWCYNDNDANDAYVQLFQEHTGANGGTASVRITTGNVYQNPKSFYTSVVGTLDSGGFGTLASQTVQTLADAIDAGWQHWAFVLDHAAAHFYINGVLVSSVTRNPGVTTEKYGNPFTIGSSNFKGKIDDFRCYDYPLSPAQVSHLSSSRGVLGAPVQYVGLGDEELWICPSLKDGARDISGNENHGTYQGGMATVASSGSGGSRAFDFDGTDDYIKILGGVGTGTTDAFCLSYWMNWEANGTEYMWDMDYTENNALSCFGTVGPAKVQASARPNSDGSGNTYNNVLTNTWVHVLFQREAGSNTIKAYFDGELKPITRTASDPITLSNDITIGNNIDGSSLYAYEGKMDDIRWFNRSLTESEILHLSRSRGISGGVKFKGVNFRQTEGFVTDPSGFDVCSLADAYYNSDRGYGFYVWDATRTRDRNSSLDPQLAGIFFKHVGTNGLIFRLDLPDGPGVYRVGSVHCDASFAASAAFSFYDQGYKIHSMNSSASVGSYMDILGNVKSNTDFNLASESYIEHDFKSGFLIVAQGPNSIGNDLISSLWVEKIDRQISDRPDKFNSDQIINTAFNNKVIG